MAGRYHPKRPGQLLWSSVKASVSLNFFFAGQLTPVRLANSLQAGRTDRVEAEKALLCTAPKSWREKDIVMDWENRKGRGVGVDEMPDVWKRDAAGVEAPAQLWAAPGKREMQARR